MDPKSLQEIVFNTLEQYGEEEGRRILISRLDTDEAFRDAATLYGLVLLQAEAESEAAPKQ